MGIVVCFSGGVESTACLVRALNNSERVLALSFDYGQRNFPEIDSAKRVCDILGVEHRVLKVPLGEVIRSGLTTSREDRASIVESDVYQGTSLSEIHPRFRAWYVPGRNGVFAVMAGSVAASWSMKVVYMGITNTGGSEYPDVQQEFIDSMQVLYNSLFLREERMRFEAPYHTFSKSRIVQDCIRMGGEEALIASYSCHNGAPHPGCGECKTCQNRRQAFEESGNTRLIGSLPGKR